MQDRMDDLLRAIEQDEVRSYVVEVRELKRKEQRRGVKNTTVKVKDKKTGKIVEKNVSASEMNRLRLEYARMLDEEKYKDERTVPLSQLENKED